jgi:hypothetical protein
MHVIDEFSIKKIRKARQEVEIKSRLYHQGRETDFIRNFLGSAI